MARAQVIWSTVENKQAISSLNTHNDHVLLTPIVPDKFHVDRIILSVGQVGATSDETTLIRVFTMPDDVVASSFNRTFPDDQDPNVWFRQVVFGGTPIYVSWRPKRTVGRGEILYMDKYNQDFAATYEIRTYAQILYHKLA